MNSEEERVIHLKDFSIYLEKSLTKELRRGCTTYDIFNEHMSFFNYINELDETYIYINNTGHLLLTDKNLYILNYPFYSVKNSININIIKFYPLYTFDKPLNTEDLAMFNNKGFHSWFYNSFPPGTSTSDSKTLKYIEHMITTIDGSYKNNEWHNIGGFIGVYVNDRKGLFMTSPPEKELFNFIINKVSY
jgi:hypothetical protein